MSCSYGRSAIQYTYSNLPIHTDIQNFITQIYADSNNTRGGKKKQKNTTIIDKHEQTRTKTIKHEQRHEQTHEQTQINTNKR